MNAQRMSVPSTIPHLPVGGLRLRERIKNAARRGASFFICSVVVVQECSLFWRQCSSGGGTSTKEHIAQVDSCLRQPHEYPGAGFYKPALISTQHRSLNANKLG